MSAHTNEMTRSICNLGRAQDLINGQKTYHPIYGDLYSDVKTDVQIIRDILHILARQIALGMTCPLPAGLHGRVLPLLRQLDTLLRSL